MSSVQPVEEQTLATQPSTQRLNQPKASITPELVQQITDKVYCLMLQELRISAERNRTARWKR